MTHKQILEKAIQKAIDGGWARPGITDEGEMHFGDRGILVDWLRGGREYMSIGDLMLAHDFAKALWGEKTIEVFRCFGYEPGIDDDDPGDEYNIYDDVIAWQYHLQEMVIAEDPIKYLGDHL